MKWITRLCCVLCACCISSCVAARERTCNVYLISDVPADVLVSAGWGTVGPGAPFSVSPEDATFVFANDDGNPSTPVQPTETGTVRRFVGVASHFTSPDNAITVTVDITDQPQTRPYGIEDGPTCTIDVVYLWYGHRRLMGYTREEADVLRTEPCRDAPGYRVESYGSGPARCFWFEDSTVQCGEDADCPLAGACDAVRCEHQTCVHERAFDVCESYEQCGSVTDSMDHITRHQCVEMCAEYPDGAACLMAHPSDQGDPRCQLPSICAVHHCHARQVLEGDPGRCGSSDVCLTGGTPRGRSCSTCGGACQIGCMAGSRVIRDDVCVCDTTSGTMLTTGPCSVDGPRPSALEDFCATGSCDGTGACIMPTVCVPMGVEPSMCLSATAGTCSADHACLPDPMNERDHCDLGALTTADVDVRCVADSTCSGGNCVPMLRPSGTVIDASNPCRSGQCDAAGRFVQIPIRDGLSCASSGALATQTNCDPSICRAGACVDEDRTGRPCEEGCRMGSCTCQEIGATLDLTCAPR